ncbi:MAG: NUDIX hydrolase [Bacteroidota bacterium]
MPAPQAWKLLNSQYIHQDKWLTVKSGTYQKGEGGPIITPFYTFEYPAWVNIFAITEDRKVVVNQQYRPGLDQVCLELPAGWVEEGETPAQCARRELLEETGYQSSSMIEMGAISANPSTHDNLNYCFLAENVKLVQEQRLDLEEEIIVQLMPIEEVKRLALTGAFVQSLHISAIFFALEKLGV